MTRKLPFEPPSPPEISKRDVAVGAVAVAGAVALDALTGGLLSTLCTVPGLEPSPTTPIAPPGTSAPTVDATGLVRCTRCAAHVPFASMSLDEHGYFCAPCARALVVAAEP